jgi:hypothetical protein
MVHMTRRQAVGAVVAALVSSRGHTSVQAPGPPLWVAERGSSRVFLFGQMAVRTSSPWLSSAVQQAFDTSAMRFSRMDQREARERDFHRVTWSPASETARRSSEPHIFQTSPKPSGPVAFLTNPVGQYSMVLVSLPRATERPVRVVMESIAYASALMRPSPMRVHPGRIASGLFHHYY